MLVKRHSNYCHPYHNSGDENPESGEIHEHKSGGHSPNNQYTGDDTEVANRGREDPGFNDNY